MRGRLTVATLAATMAGQGADIAELDGIDGLRRLIATLDRYDVRDDATALLQKNAQALRAILADFPNAVISLEGHCDERGTAEYNLALADRRALAAKSYLVSLGIAADRLKTVSYGKEFPFDPGHDEDSWSLNRRAHFTLTAK